MEKEEVKISVRELVEFILRSGDIDNRRGGWQIKSRWQREPESTKRFRDRWELLIRPRYRSTAASAMKI